MILGYSPYQSPQGSIYPFDSIFETAARLDYTPPRKCDAILLWGGTDIDPKYYGEPAHPLNHYDADCPRNQAEWAWMQEARDHGVPIIGVCRGAQFITAFAGGKLIQHVQGHGGTHSLLVLDDGEERVYQTSSSHHQMMYPFNLPEEEYQILGWVPKDKPRSKVYEGSGISTPPVECEVVLYPKIRALAIQGHPEWQDRDEDFVQWCLKQVQQLVAPQQLCKEA